MKKIKKNIFKKLNQQKKIFGISFTLTLFIFFIFGLTTFFSINEYVQQSTIPITQSEYSRSIETLNFYEDGLLKQKVSNYRNKFFNEFKDQFEKGEDNFSEYKIPDDTYITIKVNNLFDFDEKTSSIYASGFIRASWTDEGVVPLDEYMTDQELLDKSKKDVLSSSYLNFYDSEDQIYEKVSLDNSSDAKTSLYKFSGRFRLDRDLRRFPFDNSKLRIELTSLLPATKIHFFLDASGNVLEDRFRFEAFIHQDKQCYIDDFYEKDQVYKEYGCIYNELKPGYNVQDQDVDNNIISKEFFEATKKIDYYPVAVLESYFVRSGSSSFFRYILPLIAGVSVLILTENLSNKFKDIKVATPPTVLLTFIFMQNGYQSEIPQLSYITYMDKLYFLSYLLAILQLANALIIVDSRNRIERFSKKYFGLSFDKFYRFSFIFFAIVSPFILFFTS